MSEQAPTKKPYEMSPQRKRLLTLIALGFLSIGGIFILYWLLWGQFHVYTDDAYVSGNVVRVMPRVPGTVIKINTDDTYLVKQGEVLAELDNADAKIELAHAAANLALTVRRVKQYFDNVGLSAANIKVQQANLEKAKFDYSRRLGLTREKVISKEELQHFDLALQGAQSQLIAAEAQYSSASALVANTTLYQHPEVLNAKANYETAFLNLNRTTILAPITGYVAKRSVQLGQQVTPATALLAIIPLNDVWVDANYKESQIARIRIGQSVSMEADTYSGVTFHGKIVGLTPGTGSVFDLLPPQNATGNWIKIVQRLPVRVSIDHADLKDHPLLLGLSMRVTTNTFSTKGNRLATMEKEKSYQTDIYPGVADADKEADKIIKANAANSSMTSDRIHS